MISRHSGWNVDRIGNSIQHSIAVSRDQMLGPRKAWILQTRVDWSSEEGGADKRSEVRL